MSDDILIERDDGVLVVTFNRPDVHNALTPQMWLSVLDVFAEFESDDSLVVAILTGAGEDAFCAGADLGKMIPVVTEQGFEALTPDPVKRPLSDVFKPVIAAVNGVCVAGGLELMLGTDIRIASQTARFGLAEVRWGLIPNAGSHVRLPRQVPWSLAMEMLLTGRLIDADRAERLGLVNYVVAPQDVVPTAHRFARMLSRNGVLAMRTAKEIAVRSLELDAPFALEWHMSTRVFTSDDATEGPRAFIEKREPNFKDR